MATVGRGADQYTVRFPDGLRDRIKVAADANGRSMNAEIVATLEEKYPAPEVFDQLDDMIEWLIKQDRGEQRRFVLEYLSQANLPDADIERFMTALGRRRFG